MKRMFVTAILFLITSSAFAAITLVDCGAGQAAVLKNQPCELKIVSSGSVGNPYFSWNVTGVFKYVPTGQIYNVIGFYDGQQSGNAVFRIRFTPQYDGAWTWRTTSNAPSLVRPEVGFNVGASSARGFLRRSGNFQEDFVFDNTNRIFVWGMTYYQIVNTARATGSNGFWKTALNQVGNTYGMNKVRLLVFPWWKTYNGLINGGYTDSVPFQVKPPAQCGTTPPEICLNHDSIEPLHFRALDDIVKHLYDNNIIADIIIFKDAAKDANNNIIDGNRTYGTDPQDAKYLKYVVARYGAFPNVIWCLTNEWNIANGSKPKTYWVTRGNELRLADPFFVGPGNNLVRLSSIHPIGQSPTFQFFDQRADAFNSPKWASHVIMQYHPAGVDPAEWGNLSIRSNLGQSMPVFNDEFGYAGNFSRDVVRQASWGVAVAGGYGTMGDTRLINGAQQSMRAEWNTAPANLNEYNDTKLLIDFFKNIPNFFRMGLQNSIITSGDKAYALGETGVRYVFYDANGGTITANLPAPTGGNTKYSVQIYNTTLGGYTPAGTVNPGTNVALPGTGAGDWALLLTAVP